MEYFWKQNKPFVATVATWVVVALGWNGCVISPMRESARLLREERGTAEQALRVAMAGGAASDEMVSRGDRELKRQQDVLKALKADLAAPEKAPYKAPEGKGAAEYFGNLQIERWNQLQLDANQSHVGLAQRESPFGRITTPGPEASRELLLRLALVDRICSVAIDAGVERIDSISPLEGTDDPGEPVAHGDVFMSLLPVKVKLRGSSEAIFKIIHALQKKGGYYALTAFSAVKAEEHSDLFDCELEAAAMLIGEKGGVAPAKEHR